MDDIEEAFELCHDKLASLPQKYKQWKALSHYRSNWSFIKSSPIRENVCEAHMGFDYLRSLDLWLKPGLTIKTNHNLLCVLAVAAIMEGVLFDLFLDPISEPVLYEELSRWDVSKVRNLFYKKKVLNESWNKQLTRVFNSRNLIHLQKNRSTSNKKDGSSENLYDVKLHVLNKQLEDFRQYMVTKYH